MLKSTTKICKWQNKLGWTLSERDPEFIKSLMPIWEWLYNNYFHIQTSGWGRIPTKQKVLVVGSHNGGLAAPDMTMMMWEWFHRFGTEQPIYGLMHPTIWKTFPTVAKIVAKTGAVLARGHDLVGVQVFSQLALAFYLSRNQKNFKLFRCCCNFALWHPFTLTFHP